MGVYVRYIIIYRERIIDTFPIYDPPIYPPFTTLSKPPYETPLLRGVF